MKPPRRPPRLPHVQHPDVFGGDELPTVPKGEPYLAAMLVRYWASCSAEDRVYLLRLAEQFAARNAK